MERELPQEQAVFRKGRGCRDHISNIRRIMETSKEFQQNVIFCIIDYSKAFDCVDHRILQLTLKEMGIPIHLIVLLKDSYDERTAVVRLESGDSETFNIGKRVRRGCILCPHLFNLYAERIMRQAELDQFDGIGIGGLNVTSLRYADDTMITTSISEMEYMLQLLTDES